MDSLPRHRPGPAELFNSHVSYSRNLDATVMAKWKNSVLYDLLGADKRQQQNYALVYPTLVSEEELRDPYSSDYLMASG